MKVKSVIVEGSDLFRVGLELGEKLRPIGPEIIIIFSSFNYESLDEFIEGIVSAFDEKEVPLIVGGTGDGFYETEKVGEIGASAMGINSEGKIDFEISFIDKISQNTKASCQRALISLKKNMPLPSFVLCLSNFHADGTAIAETFNEQFNCPLIGGFLGQGRNLALAYGFVNNSIMKEALIFVGFKILERSGLVFDIQGGSGWEEIGEKGKITSTLDNKIITINNRPASTYLEEVTGNSCKVIDKGVIAFKITEKEGEEGEKSYIRSISNVAGSISLAGVTLYGHVNSGSTIVVCNGDPQNVLEEVSIICNRIKEKKIVPELAIVISCAGRKWLLVKEIQHEVEDVFKVFNKKFPLIGFPSFGEFSPTVNTKGSVINEFQNVTYVILVIGRQE